MNQSSGIGLPSHEVLVEYSIAPVLNVHQCSARFLEEVGEVRLQIPCILDQKFCYRRQCMRRPPAERALCSDPDPIIIIIIIVVGEPNAYCAINLHHDLGGTVHALQERISLGPSRTLTQRKVASSRMVVYMHLNILVSLSLDLEVGRIRPMPGGAVKESRRRISPHGHPSTLKSLTNRSIIFRSPEN